MLRITPVALEVVRKLQPLIRGARRREPNLAKQLDEASSSVVANLCEGDGHRGAMRRSKYGIALGEARETEGWLAMAEVKGLRVPPVGAELDHVLAVLVKVTR
jgi:four helix bundle protein